MLKNIYCVGGATIDHKLTSSAALISATSNPVSSYTSFGGVARNVAENLARWTQHIHLQCVVGNDEYGKSLLVHIEQLGVNTKHSLFLDDQETAHYYAILNTNGELHLALVDMQIYTHLPEKEFMSVWNEWQPNSIIFLDTNLPAIVLSGAIRIAEKINSIVCIDPVSVTKAKKLPSNLDKVFLIKPNVLEAAALTNTTIVSISDCIAAGKKLLNSGVENVVISLGEKGHVIVNAEQAKHITTTAIRPTDVNGAGDAFFAGILYGLQHDQDIFSACQIGACAATLTIQSVKTVVDTIKHSDFKPFMKNNYYTENII